MNAAPFCICICWLDWESWGYRIYGENVCLGIYVMGCGKSCGREDRAGARGVWFLACSLSVASLVMGVGHVILAAWWYAVAVLGRFVGRRIRYMIGRAEVLEREICDVVGWDVFFVYV